MIQSDALCYILGACMLLVLPFDWVLSFLTAALVHECCHIGMVTLFSGKIRSIHITPGGCIIDADPMEQTQTVISILAGPAGSLMLVILRKILPQIAVCGLIQGLYNLLPVLPLDGGRVLHLFLCRICPKRAEQIMRWLAIGVCLLFFFIAVWQCISMDTGILPVFCAAVFSVRILPGKIPCKPSQIKVQ